VYCLVIPFTRRLAWYDAAVLLPLFFAYLWRAAQGERAEPDLVGVAKQIGDLPRRARRAAVVALFAAAGLVILMAAEPFAGALVEGGKVLGIDEFLLVQWLAPLASEAPEFLIAALLALRGKAGAALGLLLSAKLNQWTLLVGSLPLAFSVGAGHLAALPLDSRQSAEVLLTAAQSLFGIAVLASMSLSLFEAALMAGLFIAQFVIGGLLRTSLHNAAGGEVELVVFSIVYVLISLVFLYQARRVLRLLLSNGRGKEKAQHAPVPRSG
jgi:cation:H+ antiporter